MDEIKQYKTASAFRAALEAQLHTRALDEKTDLHGSAAKSLSTVCWPDYSRTGRTRRRNLI